MMRERGVVSPSSPSRLAIGDEQIRAGRKIKRANPLVGPQQGLEVRPAGVAGSVRGDIVDAGEKTFERRSRVVVDGGEFHQRFFHGGAKLAAIEMPARDADDPGRVGELFAALAVKQRRIEFAVGQVAGAAEDDEIERINLDNARP